MKTLRLIILLIACLGAMAVSVQAKRATCEKHAGLSGPAAGKKKGTAKPDSVKAPPWQAIEVTAWPGKRFVLLEKPALYCAYGYDLYSCPSLDGCRGALDTALFTKYHRAKCEQFAGHTLTVLAIEKRGAERLITLRDALGGKKLYAKTTGGVYHEVAYANDLDSAQKRWQDRTVFSARGFITNFQDGNTFGIKVRLQDSLRVAGVRFGLTPLPAKPLWLMVETRTGQKGVIPLCYSWTNVRKELRHEGNPWDDDVYETSPATICAADSMTWETINAHHVNIGMTRDQVRMSWGRPLAVRKPCDFKGAPHECWTYEKQLLYFNEQWLAGIEEK